MLGHHMQALRETIGGGEGDYEGKETRKLVMQAIYIKKEMRVKERRRRSTLLMPTKIKSCELDVTNRQLFRSCNSNNLSESRTTTGNDLTRHSSGRPQRKKERKKSSLGCKVGCRVATRSFYNTSKSTLTNQPINTSGGEQWKGKGRKMLTLSI